MKGRSLRCSDSGVVLLWCLCCWEFKLRLLITCKYILYIFFIYWLICGIIHANTQKESAGQMVTVISNKIILCRVFICVRKKETRKKQLKNRETWLTWCPFQCPGPSSSVWKNRLRCPSTAANCSHLGHGHGTQVLFYLPKRCHQQ